MNDGLGVFILVVSMIAIGFFMGACTHKFATGNTRETTMVEFNIAHYNEKTKEFVADSLEFKNDTIIIRKKD